MNQLVSQRFNSSLAEVDVPVGNTDAIAASTEPEFFEIGDPLPGFDPLEFEEEFHALGFHGDNNPVGEEE